MKNKDGFIAKIKNRRLRLSLFKTYYLMAIGIVLACFIMMGATMVISIASQWWTDKVDQLQMNANNIAEAVINIDESNGVFDFFENLEEKEFLATVLNITAQATESEYYIVDLDGKIQICYDMADLEIYSHCDIHDDFEIPRSYLASALNNGFADYSSDEYFGMGKFLVAIPIIYDGEVVGAVFAIEDALVGLLPYITSVTRTVTSAGVIICIALFLFLFVVVKNITKPLSEMQELTTYFAKGDFSKRADETYRKKDLQQFAVSLNKMADALEVDNESKKSFVANVSHELKTPMTSIGGFIDGILDGTIPPEEERAYLQKVSNEVKRLARIVVAMLNLSKIEAGEIGLSPSRYDMKEQLFNTLLLFERNIDEKNIEILGFEDMDDIIVTADRDLIGQVVQNLMDNAVKFTPKNGVITILAEKDEDKTKVIIRNSGAGISMEEVSRVFERFYKVDKSRSFDVKGVGLGLYICKTIINMHDGEIKVGSVLGEYTEFSFEIPKLT